jgi:RHS repeat-associated protein
VTNANSNTTTFAYNAINQLTTITDSNGNTTTYTYDNDGNRASITDANGNAAYFEYNYKKDPVQITNAINGITSLSYGSTGCPSCGGGTDKLTALVDAKGNTTAYEYDLLGRVTKQTDPLGNVTTYTYDPKGNLISRTDANNKTITYTYDAIKRLTKKTYPDSTTVNFTYDTNGNMLTAYNANIYYAFTYDANNRLKTATDTTRSKTISYLYDAIGNRAQLTYPDNSVAIYTYDNAGRLSAIASSGTYSFTYDNLGRRTRLTYPTGANATYTYDAANRLTSLINMISTGTIINSYNYSLDNVGNRLTKTELSTATTYSYDPVYQLLQALPTVNSAETYSYDLLGNRMTGPTGTEAYTYNQANQLFSSSATYSYDKNGNLISKADGTTTFTYTYDYENQITRIVKSVNGTVTTSDYKYDPFGRRIEKKVTSGGTVTTTKYIYDGMNIIAEYNANNQLTTKYVQGPGIDEHLSIQKGGNVWYYHTDGLGSVTAMTDSAGAVIQTYSYDSFGNIVNQTGSIQQPYIYTGREYDSETGLYYYRARYYDTITGRFISKDPIGFRGGLNLYAYVGNNPVNFIDPYGLAGWPTLIGLGYGAVQGGLALNQAYYDWQLYNALEQAISQTNSLLNDIQNKKTSACDQSLLDMEHVATNRLELLTKQEENLLMNYGISVPTIPLTRGAKTWIKYSQ